MESNRLLPIETPSALSPDVQQKKKFLLFIKILFKYLDKSDPEIRDEAKAIVSDCTRRNRLGDPLYASLMDSIDSRLRGHVGEMHWRRAHMYMQHYAKREISRTARIHRTPPRSPPRTPLRPQDWSWEYCGCLHKRWFVYILPPMHSVKIEPNFAIHGDIGRTNRVLDFLVCRWSWSYCATKCGIRTPWYSIFAPAPATKLQDVGSL